MFSAPVSHVERLEAILNRTGSIELAVRRVGNGSRGHASSVRSTRVESSKDPRYKSADFLAPIKQAAQVVYEVWSCDFLTANFD